MSTEPSSRGFQTPRIVSSPEDCYFYHSIDLPGIGLQVGYWDLRPSVDAYLGEQRFEGKTVVDVGAASGFISFELEKRGATVISFDRVLGDRSDDVGLIPYADYERRFGLTFEAAIQLRLEQQRRLQDSYWLAHRLLGSQARLYCGNVYEGLPGVESVDVSFFGCILLHLRDPLLALTRFGRITKQTLIITDTLEPLSRHANDPIMLLRPNIHDASNHGTWFYSTPVLLRSFLEILGFTSFTYTTHSAMHVQTGNDASLYTLVAKR